MHKVVLRPRAEADLLAIADYTIARHGETQAKKYIEEIRRQIESAAHYPGMGSEAFGLPAIYRKIRSGSHLAIYRHNDGELIVVRIIHQREDVPEDFEDFE